MIILTQNTTGLSFFRKEEDTNVVRLLISRHSDPWNIQDQTRKKMLESESVMEFLHPTSDDKMIELIRDKKPAGGEMMICIDNFPCKYYDTVTEWQCYKCLQYVINIWNIPDYDGAHTLQTVQTLKEFAAGLKKFKLWIVIDDVNVELEGFESFRLTK